MVSTLEKRLMMTTIASKHTSAASCRLCHGPLVSTSPYSPPVRASSPTGEEVDCHPNCLPFACGGCVTKDRSCYGLLNIMSDGQCDLCAHDDEDATGWGGRTMLSSSP